MAKKAQRRTAAKKTAKKKAVRPAKKPRRASSGGKKSRSKRPKKKSKTLGIRNQHMDFLTYKPEQVRKFYQEMLELKAEVRDTEGLGYLVVKTSPSSSLGFMPPHPEMRGEQPLPREPTIYLMVDDIDRAYRHLSTKGVGFIGPPQEMPWGHRVASTTDPEGRTIMIASPPKKK